MILKNKHHGINTSFKRNGKFPIDADSLFSSLEAANEYLNIELTSAIPATIIGIYNELDSSENGVYEVVKTERGLELFRLSRQENNLTLEDISNAVALLNSKVNKLSDDQTLLSDNLVLSTQSLLLLIDSVKSDINDINNEINVQKPSIESINNKISDISKILNNLLKLVDDDIEFWYGSGNPLPYQSGEDIISSEEGASVYPYSQWDEYESHVGDIYLNSIDGSAWRFVYQNLGYWIRIADELSGKVLQLISLLYNLINETKELIPINVSLLNNDAGYLTEHLSLEDYVLKNSLPDFNSFALKTDIKDFVTNSTFLEYKTFISNNYFSKTDITGYATQDWVNALGFLKDFTIPDNYATKEWVLDKGYISSSEPVDLSNYALKDHTHDTYALTKHEHPEYATTNHNHTEYALKDHTHSEYALKTELPNLEDYATKAWVGQLGFITQLKTVNGNSLIGTGNIEINSSGSIDLSNYALKDHTHTLYAAHDHTHTLYAAYDHTHDNYALKTDIPDFNNYVLKTDIPNLDGYATLQWVKLQGYITLLKTINSNTLIGSGDILITTSGAVDLSGYALKEHTHINNTQFILQRTYPSYLSISQIRDTGTVQFDTYNNIYWSSEGSSEMGLLDNDVLVYLPDDGSEIKWEINKNNQPIKILGLTVSPGYLYFVCPTNPQNSGILEFFTKPKKSDGLYYYFLFGVVLTYGDFIIVEDVRSGVRFVNKINSKNISLLLKNDMSDHIRALNSASFK